MKKKHLIASICINGFLALCVVVIMLYICCIGTTGSYGTHGAYAFRFFTMLSNMYCALTSLIIFAYEIRMLKTGRENIPHKLLLLRHTGSAAVGLTFATVVLFLAPAAGANWYSAFAGSMFFFHFLNPILSAIDFVLLEKGKTLSVRETFLSLIPTALYSAVYYVEVVILKIWPDFYGFTFGGKAWAPFVVIPLILLLTSLIAFLLRLFNKRFNQLHV